MEKKYKAINRSRLVIPFTLTDSDGKTVVNRSITFNPGSKNMGSLSPATYVAREEEEIKFMDGFSGNKKNGGFLYEEVTLPSLDKKKAEPLAAKNPEPTQEKEEVINSEQTIEEETAEDLATEHEAESPKEVTVFDKVTNLQEAGMILRGINPEIKSTEIRSKVSVLKLAEQMGISFPNL